MTESATTAASILWDHWQARSRVDQLPAGCRPGDRDEGYSAQRALASIAGQRIVGWKIAATSAAGQKHIGVDGPLAGPLLANRVLEDGATIPLDGNIMMVGEAEFAFTFARALPRRASAYTQDEVLDAVDALHPAIEVPDSRYNDFVTVGAPQLIADAACADWFVLGTRTSAEWRLRDLARHSVAVYLDGQLAGTGSGANVLGDPRIALTWLVNEQSRYGDGISAGQFVTTGTCIIPVPIRQGITMRADFGDFGTVTAQLGRT